MKKVSVDFSNQTSTTWTLAVFLTIPTAEGLNSVSWQQTTAAPSGFGEKLSWTWNTPQFCVAFGSYSDANGTIVYQQRQVLDAEPGTAWKLIMKDGIQQLEKNGLALLPGRIEIQNGSGVAGSLGIGIDGCAAIYAPDIKSGVTQSFETQMNCWVAVFDAIKQGEVIATHTSHPANMAMNSFIGPKQLDFTETGTVAQAKLCEQGSSINLEINYQ